MYFYLSLDVAGEESLIRSFDQEANLTATKIRPLIPKEKMADLEALRKATWLWKTPYQSVPENEFPEDAIKSFLAQYQFLYPLLNKYRGQFNTIALSLIAHYAEGEPPRGFWFNLETLTLLTTWGMELEIDAVSIFKNT